MSRTIFILALALVAVAGSLIFTLSHRGNHEANQSGATVDQTNGHDRNHGSRSKGSSEAPTHSGLQRAKRGQRDVVIEPERLARLSSKDRDRAESLINQISRESRDKLDRLDVEYALSTAQREAIYPLVVGHHPLAHPALKIGEKNIPEVTEASLEESIFPYLDGGQRQQLADEAIDKMNWWSEIIGQIEDDLDRSLEQGVAIGGNTANPLDEAPILEEVTGPAPGDGEASSHRGGNLFDLLGP